MIPEKVSKYDPSRYEPENGSLTATLIGWTLVILLSPIWIPIAIYALFTDNEDLNNDDG